VFGERFWIEPATSGPEESWRRWGMFNLTARPAGSPDTCLLLPSSANHALDGRPVEAVHLIRDEVSNMVWGIETTVQLADGASRPRSRIPIADNVGATLDQPGIAQTRPPGCWWSTPRPSFAVVSWPRSFLRADLHGAGFRSWRTWQELRESAFEGVPRAAGTYLVYRPSAATPEFVAVGTGGHFKGRDPNVPVATLGVKWVPGAHSVYLGKGDKLQTRLKTYGRFGAGEPVAHWGGRYIWQLADADELLVAWREVGEDFETARLDEIALLARFAELYDGRRPFANLTG
jgi:hypothetical protein